MIERYLFTDGPNEEFVGRLVSSGVKFLVVGGLAVQFYWSERVVGDLDIYIDRSEENVETFISVLKSIPIQVTFQKNTICNLDEKPKQLNLGRDYNLDILFPDFKINVKEQMENAEKAFLNNRHVVSVAGCEFLLQEKRREPHGQKDIDDIAALERFLLNRKP